jgi:hypothetical protein
MQSRVYCKGEKQHDFTNPRLRVELCASNRPTTVVACVNETSACGEVVNTQISRSVTHATPLRKIPAGIQHRRSHLHTIIRLRFHVKQIF